MKLQDDLPRLFIQTVREKRHSMYRAAYSLLKSEADAEDAVQNAVEATWKRLDRIKNLDALPAYLMRAAVNAARSELRKRRRTEPLEDYADILPAHARGEPLDHYVSSLAPKYRLPLTLKYGEQLSEKEISSILRIPRGTVSSRISRALAMLRKDFEKEGSGDA